MFRMNYMGFAAAALFVAMAPAQAALITGQWSGFGSAGAIVHQGFTDFANPVGPPDGVVTVGANPSNATGSYSPLMSVAGSILDFAASGSGIGLNNFMKVGTFSFKMESVAAGSNYGGQNAWLFQDISGSVIGTLVVNGTVTDSANPANNGFFQATYTTQYLGTTSAALISTLSNGGALDLQSYSVSVNSTPEPGSWAMLLSGLGLVGAGLRRRNRK